jgi:hypothetical protein
VFIYWRYGAGSIPDRRWFSGWALSWDDEIIWVSSRGWNKLIGKSVAVLHSFIYFLNASNKHMQAYENEAAFKREKGWARGAKTARENRRRKPVRQVGARGTRRDGN